MRSARRGDRGWNEHGRALSGVVMTDELEEIWLLYVDDGSQALDAVEKALTLLRAEPGNTDAIGLLFRSMHTFKGNSRILGLSTIEHTAHVAEDLIGIVRDEGVPIDGEIIGLLIDAADALRSMMDRAFRSRADEAADSDYDLPARLKDKIARCRAESTPQGENSTGTPTSVSARSQVDGEEERFTQALVFDAASVRLADDPVYREIFFETAREALDQILAATASGGDEASLEQMLPAISGIREMAERIAIAEWTEAALLAEEALRSGTAPAIVVDRLEDVYRHSVAGPSAERCRSVENEPDPTPDAALPIPDAVIDALRAVLQAAIGKRDEDAQSVVAAAEHIAAWAADHGYSGIVPACGEVAQCAAARVGFDASAFRLADFLSRLEGAPDGAATGLIGEWSLARSPALLAEISSMVGTPPIDWSGVASRLEALDPAFASCGWQTACEAIRLMADLCCRVRDGDLVADEALPALTQSLVRGLAMALSSRAADGGADFASAEAILTETATVAGRMFRDPALVELEGDLGLPDSFRGSLSADSADRLRAALAAGRTLHIVRADLGQDQSLAARLAGWLEQPERACITSITVFNQGSTAFDFLVATSEAPQAIRAALSEIAAGSDALSLVSSLGRSEVGVPPPAKDLRSGHDTLIDANVLSEIVGEIATTRSATRQVLASFVEADLPAQADRMLHELGTDPRSLREELSRLLAGWQDKIEHLLQVEAKVATDLEQLSGVVARIRQRPASELLDGLAQWGRARADELGVSAGFTCSGHDCHIDVSHAAPLEASLRKAVEHCLMQPDVAPAAIDIHVAPGETAIEATVICRRMAAATTSTGMRADPAGGALASSLDELLRPIAGYASYDMTQIGSPRVRIVIPRQSLMIDGMIVRVSGTKYVLPVQSIQRIVETTTSNVVKVSAQSSQSMLRVGRDDVLPVEVLGHVQQNVLPVSNHDADKGRAAVGAGAADDAGVARLYVITATRSGRIAVRVDELLGQENVVVRPVQGYLASLRAAAGCAILAAGDVGIVVDPNEIARAVA